MFAENSVERSKTERYVVAEGEIVLYKLRPGDMPINPDRLWRGRVILCSTKEHLLVESLEPGYEGMREIILVTQVEKIRSVP
jgi:hypothetical protein